MALGFEKYEGLGNDFVIIESDSLPSDALVHRVCDRHFGVGADGVLVVGRSDAGARARMTVLNADGSRPEMCGNGLRCVGLHLARRDGSGNAEYRVETDAGILTCAVDRDGDSAQVVVDIGQATPMGELSTEFEGQSFTFARISVGNPHAVCFDRRLVLDEIDRLSPALSRTVPGETNVEFVVPSPDGAWDLVVWERGVGRTLACGTGAGATLAALAFAGRAAFDTPTRVRLPGGELEVTVASGSHVVRLRGPARHVFSGELSFGAL